MSKRWAACGISSGACLLLLCGGGIGWRLSQRSGGTPGPEAQENTVTDVEGNVYHVVSIGPQDWMAENLRTTRFRDGSAIPFIPDQPAWSELSVGAFCRPALGPAKDPDLFGLLYNHHAVSDSRGLCPDGWHVPDVEEWRNLVEYLGGFEVAGLRMRDLESGQWEVTLPKAENRIGFSGIPAGGRGRLGAASDVGYFATWWASTASDSDHAWHFGLHPDNPVIRSNPGHKASGFSVRCVQDPPPR